MNRLEDFFGNVGTEVLEVIEITNVFDEVYTLEVRLDCGNKYRTTVMWSDAEGYGEWYEAPKWTELGLVMASAKWENAGNENCVGSTTLSPFEEFDYLAGFFRDNISRPIEIALDEYRGV